VRGPASSQAFRRLLVSKHDTFRRPRIAGARIQRCATGFSRGSLHRPVRPSPCLLTQRSKRECRSVASRYSRMRQAQSSYLETFDWRTHRSVIGRPDRPAAHPGVSLAATGRTVRERRMKRWFAVFALVSVAMFAVPPAGTLRPAAKPARPHCFASAKGVSPRNARAAAVRAHGCRPRPPSDPSRSDIAIALGRFTSSSTS